MRPVKPNSSFYGWLAANNEYQLHAEKMVARAVRDYGVYVVDTVGGDPGMVLGHVDRDVPKWFADQILHSPNWNAVGYNQHIIPRLNQVMGHGWVKDQGNWENRPGGGKWLGDGSNRRAPIAPSIAANP